MKSALVGRERRDFWSLTLGQFLVFCGFFSFFQFPLYIKALGGDETAVGVIMGMITLASAVLLPWVTVIVERVERKLVMMMGIVLLEACTVAFMTTTAPDVYMAGLMLLRGFGFAVFMNAAGVYVAQIMPPNERSRWIGINFGFNQIAIGLGPSMGELMIRQVGFVFFFFMSTALVFAGLLLVLAITPRRGAVSTTPFAVVAPAVRFYGSIFGRRFRNQVVGLLFMAAALGAIFNFTAIYLQQIALSSGVFFLFYSTVNVACRFFGGGLSDRYGRIIVIVPTLAVFAAGILLYRHTGSVPMLAVAAGLIGFGFGLSNPAILALILDRSTPETQGLAIGGFHFAFQAGMVGTTPLFGMIAGSLGYSTMWLIAVICVVAATVVFLLPSPKVAMPSEPGEAASTLPATPLARAAD